MGQIWADYCLTEGVKALQAAVSKSKRIHFDIFVLIKADDQVHRITYPTGSDDEESATDIAEKPSGETGKEKLFYRALQRIRLLADTQAQAYALVDLRYHGTFRAIGAEVAEKGEPHAARWIRYVAVDAHSRMVTVPHEDVIADQKLTNELHPWGPPS
jgi:hypothetical protein